LCLRQAQLEISYGLPELVLQNAFNPALVCLGPRA
jgi:hypothetical protein